MTINLDYNAFIKQMSKIIIILFKTMKIRLRIKFTIKIFTTMILIKIIKFEIRKITMILMFISYHLLKLLIIYVFDATQSSFLIINFLNIYAMNVE